ncbi:hypothetical protein MCAMS1_01431 [biofilm metagenome]
MRLVPNNLNQIEHFITKNLKVNVLLLCNNLRRLFFWYIRTNTYQIVKISQFFKHIKSEICDGIIRKKLFFLIQKKDYLVKNECRFVVLGIN